MSVTLGHWLARVLPCARASQGHLPGACAMAMHGSARRAVPRQPVAPTPISPIWSNLHSERSLSSFRLGQIRTEGRFHKPNCLASACAGASLCGHAATTFYTGNTGSRGRQAGGPLPSTALTADSAGNSHARASSHRPGALSLSARELASHILDACGLVHRFATGMYGSPQRKSRLDAAAAAGSSSTGLQLPGEVLLAIFARLELGER